MHMYVHCALCMCNYVYTYILWLFFSLYNNGYVYDSDTEQTERLRVTK